MCILSFRAHVCIATPKSGASALFFGILSLHTHACIATKQDVKAATERDLSLHTHMCIATPLAKVTAGTSGLSLHTHMCIATPLAKVTAGTSGLSLHTHMCIATFPACWAVESAVKAYKGGNATLVLDDFLRAFQLVKNTIYLSLHTHMCIATVESAVKAYKAGLSLHTHMCIATAKTMQITHMRRLFLVQYIQYIRVFRVAADFMPPIYWCEPTSVFMFTYNSHPALMGLTSPSATSARNASYDSCSSALGRKVAPTAYFSSLYIFP